MAATRTRYSYSRIVRIKISALVRRLVDGFLIQNKRLAKKAIFLEIAGPPFEITIDLDYVDEMRDCKAIKWIP